MPKYNFNSTHNQVKGYGKQGRPSAEARKALADKKAESNMKVVRPGSLAWQVFYPGGRGAPSQDSASQAGPSQGPVMNLQASGGHLQWQQVGEPHIGDTVDGFSAF
ncbi:hypothetical protein BGX34_008690, partial [Mortierella sp. NVP85]